MAEAESPFPTHQPPQQQQEKHPSGGLTFPYPGTSGALQARLLELAHDAIIIRNVNSRVVVWNQGAQTLYGWTEEQARGRLTHTLFQTRFPTSPEAIDQALNDEGSWEGLLRHTTSQGHEVVVESRQVLLRDEAGQPAAILEINRDVTERERLLHERAQAQAQELAFEETIRQMDEFLSLISHEMRTPVTSLKSMVQLMLRQADRVARTATDGAAPYAQRQSELLQRAERQINRMARLLDDLLDLARMREGKLELRIERGDLRLWVQEAVEGEAISHPNSRIVIESISEEALMVMADTDRISQIVTNYLTNALKYSPEDRPIHVRIQRVDDQARVEVEDQGPGIPPEAQAHIWDLFYRVPGIQVVSGSGVGLGLGLYLCKSLIRRHGGQVGVESTLGAGACFWFSLPLAPEQPAED